MKELNPELYIAVCLGHGLHNSNIEAQIGTNRRYFESNTFYTSYEANDELISGDSLVGITGKLFSVELIKRKILEISSERWTLTLDMCRGIAMRGATIKEKLNIEIP